MLLGWFGIRSVLPASLGTQKLWSVSAESNVRKVGVGCAGSLTGMCSSFAVTTFSDGYRYSHQNWWPITVTSIAFRGGDAVWIEAITRAAARKRVKTMRMGMPVHASSTCVLPYTCAGSRPSLALFFLNFTIA